MKTKNVRMLYKTKLKFNKQENDFINPVLHIHGKNILILYRYINISRK